MNNKHKVIFLPGLSDNIANLKLITNDWRRYSLEPVMFRVGWREREISFELRLMQLIKLIDEYRGTKNMVSLVGASAGGSAAINAFSERREEIHKVVSICGRLSVGNQKGFRSFNTRTKSSPSFAQSILLCENNIKNFSKADLAKIMTVRAMFGDELVPRSTSILPGATNILVPTPEHVLSIGASLTLFSKPIISFIKS